ncbi:GNAT family N-acetyltransferase [Metabacillus arenae]|uniref:GNAT family N-acetyltransferase n=1 Tax=Metabacillus arenae TaxID=2771434 RepID=A0A926NLN1_9BACI|nr:GNAT family N-acetyltransferase [Metabacillus arenae]MBD1380307.1 GNAT family N-acetyltransferase [Metabacillus arenae]
MMFEIKKIKAKDTYPLRMKVLSSNSTLEDCQYKGDLEESSLHVGAFAEDRVIGVASFFKQAHEKVHGKNMYRLRGIAIDPEHRNQLRGQTLVLFGENLLRQADTELVWCTTGINNIEYYQHLGFKESEHIYNNGDKGLYVLMYKHL